MSRLSCASSGTMFSALSQFKPVQPWTRIFSVASHSTPQVNPNPPLGLVSAQRRFRSNDQARLGAGAPGTVPARCGISVFPAERCSAFLLRQAGRCRGFRNNEHSRRRVRSDGWRNPDTTPPRGRNNSGTARNRPTAFRLRSTTPRSPPRIRRGLQAEKLFREIHPARGR